MLISRSEGLCRRVLEQDETWREHMKGWKVELRGFEPLTPSLRTRCSAELSYSPLINRILPTSPCSVAVEVVPGDVLPKSFRYQG